MKPHQPRSPRQKPWKLTFVGGTTKQEPPSVDSAANGELAPGQWPLCEARVGDRLWITGWESGTAALSLTVGTQIEVTSRTPSGSVIIRIGGRSLGLGAFVARRIWVSAELAPSLTSAASVHPSTYLRDLPVGTRAYIVGYDRVFLGYCGKLLHMGLKPGTELRILRHVNAGQLVEVEVGGLSLRLAKPEADALCVETALPSP